MTRKTFIMMIALSILIGAIGGFAFWTISDLPNTKVLQEYIPLESSRVYSSDGKVLAEFGLKPVKNQWVKISKELPRAMYGGGGESEEHKRLKEYIAQDPNDELASMLLGRITAEKAKHKTERQEKKRGKITGHTEYIES